MREILNTGYVNLFIIILLETELGAGSNQFFLHVSMTSRFKARNVTVIC